MILQAHPIVSIWLEYVSCVAPACAAAVLAAKTPSSARLGSPPACMCCSRSRRFVLGGGPARDDQRGIVEAWCPSARCSWGLVCAACNRIRAVAKRQSISACDAAWLTADSSQAIAAAAQTIALIVLPAGAAQTCAAGDSPTHIPQSKGSSVSELTSARSCFACASAASAEEAPALPRRPRLRERERH